MDINKQIRQKLDEANTLAENEVEFLARAVLNNNHHLHEFIMAMGSYFFTCRKTGHPLFSMEKGSDIVHTVMGENEETLLKIPGYKELSDFVSEWDEELKLTGSPMRFTRLTGRKTDW